MHLSVCNSFGPESCTKKQNGGFFREKKRMIWNKWLTYATNLGVEDLGLSILYIDSFCAWLYYLVVLHLVSQIVWFGIHSPLIHT